jgi:hypothetical protein
MVTSRFPTWRDLTYLKVRRNLCISVRRNVPQAGNYFWIFSLRITD